MVTSIQLSAVLLKTIAVSVVGLVSLALGPELLAADSRSSRSFGLSPPGHFGGRLSTSSGIHGSFRETGSKTNAGGRHIRGRHFGGHRHRLDNKLFVPHQHFRRHFFPRHHGFHRDFFSRHGLIGVAPSSIVIWSDPGVARAFNVPSAEHDRHQDAAPDRPVISVMLRQRNALGLLLAQVHRLEQIRDSYQRQAIRSNADIRIAEMEVQTLLEADPVNLEQVRLKLQEIEHLKVELRLARIGAIEQAKALLSPEQREKLAALLGETQYSGPP
jgi:Spy/CpxP family protein refolding chaperone